LVFHLHVVFTVTLHIPKRAWLCTRWKSSNVWWGFLSRSTYTHE